MVIFTSTKIVGMTRSLAQLQLLEWLRLGMRGRALPVSTLVRRSWVVKRLVTRPV